MAELFIKNKIENIIFQGKHTPSIESFWLDLRKFNICGLILFHGRGIFEYLWSDNISWEPCSSTSNKLKLGLFPLLPYKLGQKLANTYFLKSSSTEASSVCFNFQKLSIPSATILERIKMGRGGLFWCRNSQGNSANRIRQTSAIPYIRV